MTRPDPLAGPTPSHTSVIIVFTLCTCPSHLSLLQYGQKSIVKFTRNQLNSPNEVPGSRHIALFVDFMYHPYVTKDQR